MSKHKTTYEFRFEGRGSRRLIYASFRDYRGRKQETLVTEEVYLELVQLNRSIKNLAQSTERHIEYRSLSDEALVKRGAPTYPSAEEEALNNLLREELRSAISELPTTQARRYRLVRMWGYSLTEIARKEGCSIPAVWNSVTAAEKNLQEILGDRVKNTPSN